MATASQLGYDNSIRLWDASTGRMLRVCEGHESVIDKVVFTVDGTGIISSSTDGTMRLWDVQTGKEIRKYPVPEGRSHNVPGMALSLDGSKLTSIHCEGEEKQLVIVWDVSTGNRLLERHSHSPSFLNIVPFSADAKVLAEPGDKVLNLREVATGELLLDLKLSDLRSGESLQELVAFSSDGRIMVAVTCTYRHGGRGYEPAKCTLHLWELTTGKVIWRIRDIKNWLNAVAFSPDGRIIATAGEDLIQLWEVATGNELFAYRGHDGQVSLGALAFSPDGKRLAAAYRDSTARSGM